MAAADTKVDGEVARKEEVAKNLAVSAGLMMLSVTMIVPTRAPMVLAIKNGDIAATARSMGIMSSCAAIVELFVNPVLGRMSDQYGRRPFMMVAPLVNAFLHSMVALMPTNMTMMFVDRMISGSMIFAWAAPMQAAFSDLFADPKQLAMAGAKSGTFFGLGCAIGPFLGAKFGGARSMLASAVMFVITSLWISAKIPETLKDESKKEFRLAASNPLAFLNLFRTKTLASLTATLGLQSFGDYANIYDINNLYLKSEMDYGQQQVGTFAMSYGFTQIAGGLIGQTTIKSFGQKTHTLIQNVMMIVGMGLLGTSRNGRQLAICLMALMFSHQKSTGVGAYLQKHGTAAGMGRGEIVASTGNLNAIIKVFAPLVYSNLFAWATTHGRKVPGAPYFLIGFLTALSQLAFQQCDPDLNPSK